MMDLTAQLAPYLDRQLLYPLLHFLSLRDVYPPEDVLRAKYDLLRETKLVEFTTQIYKELHAVDGNIDAVAVPEPLQRAAEAVAAEEAELTVQVEQVMALLENPEVVASLRQDKVQNMQFLQEAYGFTSDQLNTLYAYGRFQYDRGNYGSAADLLYHFRVLSTDVERNLSALWGKLACEILTGNWDGAYEDLLRLRELVDLRTTVMDPATGVTTPVTPVQQLQQRTWLLHWSLFVFFNHPRGREAILDMWLQPAYINTIHTACPWLLRYLAAVVVAQRRRTLAAMSRATAGATSSMSTAAWITARDSVVRACRADLTNNFQDPLVDFLVTLLVDFDFERATQGLDAARRAVEADFFLASLLDEWLDSARVMVVETYAKVHEKIDIAALLTMLGLEDRVVGEAWLVALIRETRVDARLDFHEDCVNVNVSFPTVYQQVIEKTKGVAFRTQVLATKLEKRQQAVARAHAQQAAAAAGALDALVE